MFSLVLLLPMDYSSSGHCSELHRGFRPDSGPGPHQSKYACTLHLSPLQAPTGTSALAEPVFPIPHGEKSQIPSIKCAK